MIEYFSDHLRSRLEWPEGEYETLVPRLGLKSDILLVRNNGPAHHIIRFLRNTRDARDLLRADQQVNRHDLPAPRLAFHEISLAHRTRRGFDVLVEEFLPGVHLGPGELTEHQLESLADALARFHRVECPKVKAIQWQNPRRYYRNSVGGKLLNRLTEMKKHSPELETQEVDRIVEFVNRTMERWKNPPSFVLTHDKINKGNVIFSSDNRASLIDLATLRFNTPGKDLVTAMAYFCSSPEDEALLREFYFRRMIPAHREHFEEFEVLYRVWFYLSRWAGRSRAFAKRVKKKGPLDRIDQAYATRFDDRRRMWEWLEKAGL